MEGNDESWNRHQWSQPKPRRVEIESNKPLLQRHCICCGRDFVTDPSSGNTFAVLVSVTSFHRLAEEVTARWLKESCPGKRLQSDDTDRERKITELHVRAVRD
jgi:hypothetical protein